LLNNVDGLNMKEDNMWQRVGEKYYYYQNKKGIQYIGDCSDKNIINNIDKKYDLILSSHQIEHLANPIKTLLLYKKLLNINGYILSIIPNKNMFWDINREYTTIEHMLNDYNNNIGEDDKTHLYENLNTSQYKSSEDLTSKAYVNYKTRVMHHHCFNDELVKNMFEYVGFETLYCFVFDKDPLQIIYFGKKID
jgi:hypothetical protein